MTVELFQVGGYVRDKLMGLESKDVDFSVVAGSFDELVSFLDSNGFTRFVTTPEYLTVRAHCPKGFVFAGQDVSRLTADFVLARKEGEYTDGRRPDEVTVGTLEDDLRRRDFTVNALALDIEGNLIDMFDGVQDLENKLLRAVGSAQDRIREDALRAIRAIRFSLTKGFALDEDIVDVLNSGSLPDLVSAIAVERRMDELDKMLKFDTLATLAILESLPGRLKSSILTGYRLTPTLKKVK